MAVRKIARAKGRARLSAVPNLRVGRFTARLEVPPVPLPGDLL
jgi:hypothetical protein